MTTPANAIAAVAQHEGRTAAEIRARLGFLDEEERRIVREKFKLWRALREIELAERDARHVERMARRAG